jgi:hypothetical protein
MRRMLFGLAVGLLTFTGSAWAGGPIVRWDHVVGNIGTESDSPNLMVAGISPSPRWFSMSGGRVMLNLESGFVSIKIDGISGANHRPGSASVLGTTIASAARGLVVCNSSERYGTPTVILTDEFVVDDGDVSYSGVLALTEDCRQNPEDLVFLLQLKRGDGTYGWWHAFGTDRHIQ